MIQVVKYLAIGLLVHLVDPALYVKADSMYAIFRLFVLVIK